MFIEVCMKGIVIAATAALLLMSGGALASSSNGNGTQGGGGNGSSAAGPWVDCKLPDGSVDYLPMMICTMQKNGKVN
ncbi:hypothetical protein GCM10007086_21280 [Photobacterium aphoticum]|uniref:Secreted protein n=2 Tax=Photobacterium aphoticum TaxID=754436 RepID=A0A090QVD2_9GAMM|nr:hypothetical protein ABT58_02720 [Photobacterium aphoticum]PSU55081.1 hypothetical protein C9I90_17695 [Photobacterium aphoticum]GAL06851.1 hypothetical protein JCM19237_3917 [Photobacterium aphoticum]GHA47213.1 hypothetical protein GCM10007086_21280 [Photobacterium aphoticum]